MKVLVCGGRNYSDQDTVHAVLDGFHEQKAVTCIIEGGANGADAMARRWADRRRRELQTFRADWRGEGLAAGPKRNQRMLDQGKPDIVIAFAGGRGTADMVKRARASGVPVYEVP